MRACVRVLVRSRGLKTLPYIRLCPTDWSIKIVQIVHVRTETGEGSFLALLRSPKLVCIGGCTRTVAFPKPFPCTRFLYLRLKHKMFFLLWTPPGLIIGRGKCSLQTQFDKLIFIHVWIPDGRLSGFCRRYPLAYGNSPRWSAWVTGGLSLMGQCFLAMTSSIEQFVSNGPDRKCNSDQVREHLFLKETRQEQKVCHWSHSNLQQISSRLYRRSHSTFHEMGVQT